MHKEKKKKRTIINKLQLFNPLPLQKKTNKQNSATTQKHLRSLNTCRKAKSACSAGKGRKLHQDNPETKAQFSKGHI